MVFWLTMIACKGTDTETGEPVDTGPVDTQQEEVPDDTSPDTSPPDDTQPDSFVDIGDSSGPPGDDTQVDTAPPYERYVGDYALADARARIVGEDIGDSFGHGLRGLGDLDGDGAWEVGFGAPGQDAGELDLGALYVSEGSLDGELLAADFVRLHGGTPSQQDQIAVAAGGDLDGDGLADALLGHAQDGEAGSQAGAVFVVGEALASGPIADEAFAKIVPDRERGFLGVTADGLGDIDGDGVGDLVIGTHADAGWVLPGPLSGTLVTRDAGHKVTSTVSGGRIGIAVAGIGDTDGDVLNDIAISGHGDDHGGNQSGAVYVFVGPLTGDRVAPAEVDGHLYNTGTDTQAGKVVAGAGDVDGDGYDDVLLGSFTATPAGDDRYYPAAWLVRGPATGEVSLAEQTRFDGPYTADELSLDGAGDVDGDGHADLVFGSWSRSLESGAWLAYGPATGGVLDESDVVFVPETKGDAAGASVAGAGDVDGDGRAEVLVSGFWAEEDRGVAWVLSP